MAKYAEINDQNEIKTTCTVTHICRDCKYYDGILCCDNATWPEIRIIRDYINGHRRSTASCLDHNADGLCPKWEQKPPVKKSFLEWITGGCGDPKNN